MRIKNNLGRQVLLGAAVIGAMAVAASANTIVLQQGAYSAGTGGEFKVTSFSGLPVQPSGPNVVENGSLFQTFCIEQDEYFTPGHEYQWDLNTQAIAGGNNTDLGDPLDPKTAYLFTQFYNGVLNGYDYTDALSQRKVDAGELQEAIWYIEDEIGGIDGEAQTWLNEATAAVADASKWGNTIGNVRVLNVWDTHSPRVEHQDVLVVVPTPQAALAGMSLLAGIGVVGYIRRRTRSEFS